MPGPCPVLPTSVTAEPAGTGRDTRQNAARRADARARSTRRAAPDCTPESHRQHFAVFVTNGFHAVTYSRAHAAHSTYITECYRARSEWQDRRSGRPPSFERGMRLRSLLQRKALPDIDPDRAALDLVEEMPRHVLTARVIGKEGEQRGPSQLERTLSGQCQQAHRLHRARRIAEGHHHAKRLETVERTLERVLAHTVHDHIDTRAIGQRLDLGREIVVAIVDAGRGPVLQRKLAFLIRACRSDQPDPLGPRPLTREQADTTGSGVKEHGLSRLQWPDAVKEIFDRHTLQHDRGRVLE